MTISDDTIKKAVQRYHREYDRYLKLAARVAEICRSEIVEGNAIRAQVTSRAKSPKSLEGKLRRFAATGKKSIPDVDAVFDQIRDLAAVRVATYEQRHEEQVVQLVCKRFIDVIGQRPLHERKDKNRDDTNNFYRASHVEVFLTTADGVGTYANVMDVPCEVQVCSMMAHVWNEIEHDLGYKPAAGVLSDQERNFLVMLGQSVRVGDGTISSLFAETERRQHEQGGAFADVYDFVARLRGWFPGVDFGRNAGALFEALQPIRLVSPDSIRRLLALPEPLTDAGRAALDAFSRRLETQGDSRFSLDPNSSGSSACRMGRITV
jgi:ppGpp synthetase/RelA/SpoT-type nucleotidyltranferase